MTSIFWKWQHSRHMSSVLPLYIFLPSSQLCLPLHLPTHVVHLFFLIYHLSSIFVFSLQPCFYLLTPPCSPIFCLLLPCPSLSLSNERGIFERKRVREKERQQKGGWSGGVGPYKSSCLQPPRSQKHHTETEERNHTLTNCIHPRDLLLAAPEQVRNPWRAGGSSTGGKETAWPLTFI